MSRVPAVGPQTMAKVTTVSYTGSGEAAEVGPTESTVVQVSFRVFDSTLPAKSRARVRNWYTPWLVAVNVEEVRVVELSQVAHVPVLLYWTVYDAMSVVPGLGPQDRRKEREVSQVGRAVTREEGFIVSTMVHVWFAAGGTGVCWLAAA